MPVFNNVLAGAAGSGGSADGGYQISRSIRLNSSDSSYLSRTPSSAGNQKTFTWSGWIKRTEFGGNVTFFSSANSNTSNPRTDWEFYNDTLYIGFNPSGSSWLEVKTTRKFRDPSAWYHIVVAVDTTQGTNTDRVKIYVNGERETNFQTYSTFTQNSDLHINSAVQHSIGRYEAGDSNYFPGYLTEVHFIDGQALAATDFGEYDNNGVWQPKEFTGSYTVAASGTTTSLSQVGWASSNQANIWDGNTSTRAVGYNGGSIGTITFTPPLTNVTKVEVYAQDYNHFLNGSSVSPSESGTGWHTYYDGSAITLSSLGNAYSNNTQTVDMYAIRINDTLVDAQSWTPPSGVGLQGGGANSFSLKFADNSSNAALGNDAAGSNNWTVNNLSVASGAGNDSLIDTPTNYTAGSGNNGGNYATLNPLHNGQTLSNGNLDVTGGSSWQRSVSTIAMSSGKWYWEYEVTASNEHIVGVGPLDMQMSGNLGAGSPPGSGYLLETGNVNGTGANSSWSTTGGSTAGDCIGVAFDADAGSMYIYKNGTALNSGIPSHTGLTNGPYYAVFSLNGSSRSGAVNFGQRTFKYTPPTGYVSLCTANLPDPTIADPSTAFDAKLYTGNGSTQSISGFNFQPDFVWIKSRTSAGHHSLNDSVRSAGKILYSNLTNAENTSSIMLTAFNSAGFSVGSDNDVNKNNDSFVSWAWDAGSSTVSNTDGSITSSVRASPSTGCSIVTASASSAGDTIGHSLNAEPSLIVAKRTDTTSHWPVYHSSIGANGFLYLNLNNAAGTGSDFWNNSAPTSSVFTVGSDAGVTGGTTVFYCFAPVSGYSSFGSFNPNGTTDNSFVYTGFLPKFLLLKYSSSAGDWMLLDTSRRPNGPAGGTLVANVTNAEDGYYNSNQANIDFLSNGFKIRVSGSPFGDSGRTVVYAAFAEHPFKYSRAY